MPGNYSDTSIIVACFNEEKNIERCLTAVVGTLPGAEIVVVAGGTDGTLDIARQLAERWPQIKPVENRPDFGKGHAVQRGIAEASGKYMAQFDADLQFMAEDLPALLAPVRSGQVEVTLGSRFMKGSDRGAYRPVFFRDAGNWSLSFYISTLIGVRVTDVTAGVKAWTREAIRRIDFRDLKYSYEAEIVVRAARLGLRLQEIPVRYADRAAGESMHRSTFALGKAGAVIMWKSLLARWRSVR